jgi:outer membrane protein OmpA-like peptidoglycan-associated protein
MKQMLVIFLMLNAYLAHSQSKDTFDVYFPFNKPGLTKEATDYIDQLVFKDTLIHGNKLMIVGYADFVGGNAHNDTLSRLRAKNVKDYLASMGFDKDDITLCVGKGKIDRKNMGGKNGYAADRKVEIIIERTAAPPPKLKGNPKPAEKVDIGKLAVNQSFSMTNICFEPGSPILLPQSYPILKTLLGYMNQYPTLKIRIEGHVCCIGPNEGDAPYQADVSLSEARAMTIQKYLVDKGVKGDRVKAIGLGNRNPVVPEELTEEDRVKNRRVEIRILSK